MLKQKLIRRNKIANEAYVVIETKRLITNVSNQHRKCTRLDKTKCCRWSSGNCARNEILPYEQVVYTGTRIQSGEWDAQSFLGFWDTNRSPNLGQTTRPSDSQKKKKEKKEKKRKKNLLNSWLCYPGRPQSKKGYKKIDKSLDLTKELKK